MEIVDDEVLNFVIKGFQVFRTNLSWDSIKLVKMGKLYCVVEMLR